MHTLMRLMFRQIWNEKASILCHNVVYHLAKFITCIHCPTCVHTHISLPVCPPGPSERCCYRWRWQPACRFSDRMPASVYLHNTSHHLPVCTYAMHIIYPCVPPQHIIYLCVPTHRIIYLCVPTHSIIYWCTPTHIIYLCVPPQHIIYLCVPTHRIIYLCVPTHCIIYWCAPTHIIYLSIPTQHICQPACTPGPWGSCCQRCARRGDQPAGFPTECWDLHSSLSAAAGSDSPWKKNALNTQEQIQRYYHCCTVSFCLHRWAVTDIPWHPNSCFST